MLKKLFTPKVEVLTWKEATKITLMDLGHIALFPIAPVPAIILYQFRPKVVEQVIFTPEDQQ